MRQTALVVALCLFAGSLFAAESKDARRELSLEEKREVTRAFLSSLRLKPIVPRTLSNGSVVAQLDDSYLNFYMARITPEGGLEFSCVNTPSDAITVLTTPAPSIMRIGSPHALPMEEK